MVKTINEKEIAQIFHQRKFRATPQRIAIYKYLVEHPTHPDADEIYRVMLDLSPSFSKTTVYNALQSLESCGLIIQIKIDNDRIHYDADTNFHGHFICEKCKKIFDFAVDGIKTENTDAFEIKKRDVYYSGICPDCKV